MTAVVGPIVLQTEGEVIFAAIPQDHPGPYSEVVRVLRDQLPGVWIDWVAVREAFRYGRGRLFPVARRSADASTDEKAKVRFSPDALTAYLLLFPPKPRGQRFREPELFGLISAYGVPPELLDAQAVRMAILRRSYREAEPIAVGRAPVDGRSARVDWSAGCPTDPEGFLAVLETLGENYPDPVLHAVAEGQDIGFFHAPQPGTAGFSAMGTEIPARAGSNPVHLGKGLELVAEQDRQTVRSARPGHLRLRRPGATEASVLPLLRVRDAQDLERWRNEIFPGSIIVEGDLEVRFPIRVLGDMEVRGGLVRTSIEVMGSLFVRDGVIHHGRAPVKVGGILSAAFLDRAWVVAHTVLVRRYSLQSRISGREAVIAQGPATICGGQVSSRFRIEASALGSSNNMATEVSVGNSTLTTTFQDLYYSWAAALRAQCLSQDRAGDELVEAAAAWERAAQELTLSDAGTGRVSAKKVYPGVSVRIASATREVSNPVGPVTFTYERIGPRDRVAMSRE